MPTAMLKAAYNTVDKKKIRDLLNVITSGLKLNKYLKIKLKLIDMIEMPDQMVSRLSNTFAQFPAENSSEKLKNEIKQLLYLQYCLKK